MEIKDLSVLNIHPSLIPILDYAIEQYGLSTITSAYRPGDVGVHGQMPVRGVDFRCRNAAMGTMIQDDVNAKWQYDPERPGLTVCVAHGDGANFHLHFQVHRFTTRRT